MLTRYAKRFVRRQLAKRGLEVRSLRYDFDSHFISARHHGRIIDETIEVVQEFLIHQHIFPIREEFDPGETIREFLERYAENPVKTSAGGGGCGFNAQLFLFVITRALNPILIVESGTYLGGSAWLFRKSAEDAELLTFDVDHSNLLLRDPSVSFHESDWSSYSFGTVDPDRSMCFFDDHQNQIRRVLEARDKGFRYLIFDDNAPVNWLYLAGAGAPTIDFLSDPGLEPEEEFHWRMLGQMHRYRVNRAEFEEARKAIKAIVKVPELHRITGCAYQLPLTLVEIRV